MPCSARCHFAGIEFAGDLLRQRFDRKLREYMFSRLVRFSWPLLQRCNCEFADEQAVSTKHRPTWICPTHFLRRARLFGRVVERNRHRHRRCPSYKLRAWPADNLTGVVALRSAVHYSRFLSLADIRCEFADSRCQRESQPLKVRER